ncbi:MAG: tetraacyldisaccharide 4'-kinase [Betaproteobacteria bacterium]|nr:tetraacyldisaccharide 4'-kinase [Betaproteobacteria bacterium]
MSTELSTSASGRSWLEEIIWKHWFLIQGSREKLAVTDKIVLSILGLVFRPLAQIVVRVSRGRLEQQVNAPSLPGIPVVAIGNWIVGGAGKTPACIAVATALRDSGHHVGIVSAGYRRDASMDRPPLVLNEESLSQTPPAQSGDEPWLLAWRTGCPVAVHKNRLLAAQALLEAHPRTNLILLDDGLSQVTLRPDIRILVLDDRLHGNGRCMPWGPLRQSWPPPKAMRIDFVLLNQFHRSHQPVSDERRAALDQLLEALPSMPELGPMSVPLSELSRPQRSGARIQRLTQPAQTVVRQPALALAGIARPERFFQDLEDMGVALRGMLPLRDHEPHPRAKWLQSKFSANDDELPLLMTEKDAVKFFFEEMSDQAKPSVQSGPTSSPDLDPRPESLASSSSWWAVSQSVELPAAWIGHLLNRIRSAHGPTPA